MRLFACVFAMLMAWSPSAHAETIVLDSDGDRALVGEILPAAPNTDPVLRMRTHLERAGRPTASALDGRVLSFARLLPGERFLGVTPEGRLYSAKLRDGGDEVTIDEGVQGAVSASPDGRHLAYCKGDEARQEVFRADDGRPSAVTTGMNPAWSPAISPDGRAIVFVSAKTGVPALFRARGAGAPEQLTNLGVVPQPGVVPQLQPFPDAMTAPLLSNEPRARIVFEAQGAVHVLDGGGRPVRVLSGAVSPAWIKPGRTVRVFRPGATTGETVDLTARETAK